MDFGDNDVSVLTQLQEMYHSDTNGSGGKNCAFGGRR